MFKFKVTKKAINRWADVSFIFEMKKNVTNFN